MPRTFLVGDVAAVLHYNAFSRIFAGIMCNFFGVHLINYFGDFGCPLPDSLVKMGLRIFRAVCGPVGHTGRGKDGFGT